MINLSEMTDQEITELAAILVNEYGNSALGVAERRRDQHAHEPNSDSYRVWARIAAATDRLLRVSRRECCRRKTRSSTAAPTRDQRGRRTW